MNAHRPSWPNGVHPIALEDLDRLGINSDNQLFWDGNRVEIRRALTLTTLQKLLAVIVSVFAILGGIGGFVTGYNNATVFLCARSHNWLSCPTPMPQGDVPGSGAGAKAQ